MTVRASGLLARFAVEGGRVTDSGVKPKLFQPNRTLKLSVFRIDGLVCAEIRDLGMDIVRKHPNAHRLHGWGEVSESAVCDAGLRVDHDDVPPRHANIVGWPNDASEQKLKQIELAHSARAIMLNPPVEVGQES